MSKSSKTWTPEIIRQALDLHNKGKTLSEIAKALDVTRSSVSGMMMRNRDLFPKQRDINIAGPRRQWTEDELVKMEELYRSGMPIHDIGKHFGASHITVTSVMNRRRDRFPLRETPATNFSKRAPKSLITSTKFEEALPSGVEIEETLLLDDFKKQARKTRKVKPPEIITMPAAVKDLPPFYVKRMKYNDKAPELGKELVLLDKEDCRYPISEDAETVGRWRFCGKPRNLTSSYCDGCNRKMQRGYQCAI